LTATFYEYFKIQKRFYHSASNVINRTIRAVLLPVKPRAPEQKWIMSSKTSPQRTTGQIKKYFAYAKIVIAKLGGFNTFVLP
jgi:hypothetical protein